MHFRIYSLTKQKKPSATSALLKALVGISYPSEHITLVAYKVLDSPDTSRGEFQT